MRLTHVGCWAQALTSSWADGSRGPICFCLPEGAIPAASMREWNAKHVGASYIISTETSSHFMHSNSLLEIYDQCYSVAFHLQRKKILSFINSMICLLTWPSQLLPEFCHKSTNLISSTQAWAEWQWPRSCDLRRMDRLILSISRRGNQEVGGLT